MTLAPALFSTPMMERLPEKAKKQILRSAEFPVRFGHPDEFAQAVVTIIENSILVSPLETSSVQEYIAEPHLGRMAPLFA